jgi:acyl carrier protein
MRATLSRREFLLDTQLEVLKLLDEVLNLQGRAMSFSRNTLLLGAVPELDSMAVVTLITTMEDRFGISVEDDEISGETFESVGSLADFVAARMG